MVISNTQKIHPETAELLRDLDCFNNNGSFDSSLHRKLIIALDKKLSVAEEDVEKAQKLLRKIIKEK